MNLLNAKYKILFGVVAIVILSTALMIIQKANASSVDENINTPVILIPPTPDIYLLGSYENPIPALPQRNISRMIDLAVGLSDDEIFVYIVLRENGIYEEYHIPATYSGDENILMGLSPGDRIVTGYPIKPIISTPVLEPPQNKIDIEGAIPTSEPYPQPSNENHEIPVVQPYP